MTPPPCLEFDDVTLRHGAVAALDAVSLTICHGERVALVGPSGAGKSTFIAVANTSAAPTSGVVRLFAEDPTVLDQRRRTELRTRIGTVHQGLNLPGSLRVVHNVNAGRLGAWSTRRALTSLVRPHAVDEARAALESFGLGDALWRRTDELSGGEKQRVALARLVVQGADLVLADEPTASLDPARAHDVLQLFTRIAAEGQRTLVVSIHSFDLARSHFERVIGLRAGRVMFDLPATEVSDALGARLYDLEAS
jgi:phosphonate transport system ATP-binding protein